MRHSLATRVLASIVAVWFGFLTIQPLYADPCPHHQPALAELAQGMAIHTDAGQAMAAAAVNHDVSGKPAANAHAMHGMPGHDGPGNQPCECLGAMCGTAPIAIAQTVVGSLPEIVTAEIATPAMPPISHTPKASPPHTLPFATAPPPAQLA